MKLNVIIPIYRPRLPENEAQALLNNTRRLSQWDITLLCPEGLDISAVSRLVPTAAVVRVSDEWLGSRNGIQGYNRMMLSEEFYRLFEAWDYVLVCHTDAWIFRDELEKWCVAGYDCVAAPWVRRAVYDLPVVRQYMSLRRAWAERKGIATRQRLYDRIGNGGLSLRKVSSFLRVCREEQATIDRYIAARHHLYNEDVFWATVPGSFRYPTTAEALKFAFDTNPSYCFRLTDNTLPMGCHSWNKKKMWRFWQSHIHF